MMKQIVTFLLLILFLSSTASSNQSLYQKVITDPIIVSGCELPDQKFLPAIEAKIAKEAPALNKQRRDILSWQSMVWCVEERLRKQIDVSAEEISAYYQEMNHLYVHDRVAYFEYIFSPTSESNTAEQIELLKEFRYQFQSQETNWTRLKIRAQTNSLIVSPQRVVASPGQYSPVIDKAVFETPAGEVSEVLETDKGFHLIYVTKQIPVKNESLENVSDQIREVLHQKKAYEKRRELLDKLRTQYPLIPTEENGFKIGGVEVTSNHLQEVGLPEVDLSNQRLMEQLESSADAVRLYLYGKEEVGTDDEGYLLTRRYMTNNYKAQNHLEHIQSNATSSIKDWKSEYEENKGEYFSDEQRHVYSFEMSLDVSSAERLVESQEIAKSTLSKVKEALAEGKSIEQTKYAVDNIRLIDLDMAPKGPRGPLVDLSVEELEAGQTTGVIFQQQRAFVFYVADVEPSRQLSFDEAQEIIKTNINNQRGVEQRNELVCNVIEKTIRDER